MGQIKIKLHKKQIFFALLIITYVLRSYTDAVFVSKQISSTWTLAKYVTLFAAIAYGYIYLFPKKNKWQGRDVLKYVGITAATFLIISFVKMLFTDTLSTKPVLLAFNMIYPAIIVMLAINIGDQNDIYNCCKWILLWTFAIYCIFEIGLSVFSKDFFAKIIFADSTSPFESHYSAGTAAALCAFFCYFRKNRVYTVLSLIFALLVFKRMLFIGSIVLFVLPMFVNVKKHVKRWAPGAFAALFFALTLVYYWLLIPENQHYFQEWFGVSSVIKLTSTRSLFFEAVYTSDSFVNFGWGACEAHLGRLFEMDLLQMLIEVSVVGLGVFAFCYWRIAGTTIYGMLYMAYNFCNMLASHSISGGYIWCLILLTFKMVELDAGKNTNEKLLLVGKKQRKRGRR